MATNRKQQREKSLEALLVIATGFLVLFLIKEKRWMLYVAFSAGMVGIFIRPLATLIARGWYKLGDLLGFVVSKVILFILFFLFLTPIAFLYRIFHRDTLRLKNRPGSFWSARDHLYLPGDLKNPW